MCESKKIDFAGQTAVQAVELRYDYGSYIPNPEQSVFDLNTQRLNLKQRSVGLCVCVRACACLRACVQTSIELT